MAGSLSLEQKKKIDLIAETLQNLTKQFRELTDTYRETILKETQSMRTFMEEALASVRREVAEAIRNMKQQPNVLREVEEVTPTAVKKSIERKGLTSPNALILGVLNKTVTPTEMVYALEAIRARQKLRGKLID